ncbi:MAG: hypothetical protein Q4G50_06190 [Corynebacterium sp.]|uniref:hypothetical protein n=1 Tax=Corynebacterium sp. TaxID=1720 RepID=UPI0026E04C97|nr:hypothetical protein [Corynebacterium sp.]MDO5669575.1 hypothetical protein [Corynebacterium sp.]
MNRFRKIAIAVLTSLIAVPSGMAHSVVPINSSQDIHNVMVLNQEDSIEAHAIVSDGPSEYEINRAIEKHLDFSIDKRGIFDDETAQADGVDPEIIRIGVIRNHMIGVGGAEISPQGWQAGTWNYGRWCGPNQWGPGEPIDSLDRACMNHDICIQQGTAICDCDYRFVQNLRVIRPQYPWGTPGRAYLEAAIVVVPRAHGCGF